LKILNSLYLHIPFCERKCVYCSFYSIESFANQARFMEAIVREIDGDIDEPGRGATGEPIGTIFFGGGTPSVLSPDEIGRIMTAVGNRYAIADDAEITMECNPGALNRDWLEGYRAAGINRLSFGVQSFHDDDLQFLSRIHTAAEAEENIRLVRQVFDNVSLDLIFALPDQTLDRWRTNLERAIDLGTDHISAYALIFEEGTPLNAMRLKGRVRPATNDQEADMYEATMATLGAAGFAQYETSNYARPGRACRHNIGYWERGGYDGFGPSAHSFRRRGVLGERRANVSSLNAYLEAVESGSSPVIMREQVTPELATEEIVMLGLRYRGIDRAEFRAAAGADVSAIAAGIVEKMVADAYATLDAERLSLTPKGTIFADRFALDIIDAVERSGQLSPQ
jgi:oxygen-independent coproporphyrinogen-3 oxidase